MAAQQEPAAKSDRWNLRPGRVVVCGNVVLDILARSIDEPLRWGTTTFIDSISQQLGGNAGSTSFALGKLGVPVSVATLMGRDDAAETLLERLRTVDVDLTMALRVDAPTSTALSIIRPGGERALFYQAGASAEDFPPRMLFTNDTAHFHLAAVYRMKHLRSRGPGLLREAKAAGMATSLDTQWDTEGEWMRVLAPSLPYSDYTLVNEDEARMLTGHTHPPEVARVLRDAGATAVVVKLGAKGCWANGEFVGGFAVSAVDTTGAGDCFNAGFLAGLRRGMSVPEAARLGNAVGALSVQQVGATAGLCDFAATSQFMSR